MHRNHDSRLYLLHQRLGLLRVNGIIPANRDQHQIQPPKLLHLFFCQFTSQIPHMGHAERAIIQNVNLISSSQSPFLVVMPGMDHLDLKWVLSPLDPLHQMAGSVILMIMTAQHQIRTFTYRRTSRHIAILVRVKYNRIISTVQFKTGMTDPC